MRGLPFYVKREAFARADTRQRVAYILSAVLVITMLCVIFRFSAADATHSSHLSEGVCIRLVRELNSVFPEQFPKEKLVKVAEAIEYPIRKCAHFTRICSAWYYGESLFVDVLSNGDAFEQKEKSKRYTTDRGKITKNCKTESCSTGECTAGNKKYQRESYSTGISNTGNRNCQTDSRKH